VQAFYIRLLSSQDLTRGNSSSGGRCHQMLSAGSYTRKPQTPQAPGRGVGPEVSTAWLLSNLLPSSLASAAYGAPYVPTSHWLPSSIDSPRSDHTAASRGGRRDPSQVARHLGSTVPGTWMNLSQPAFSASAIA